MKGVRSVGLSGNPWASFVLSEYSSHAGQILTMLASSLSWQKFGLQQYADRSACLHYYVHLNREQGSHVEKVFRYGDILLNLSRVSDLVIVAVVAVR